jgi:WD40 repeat protein
LFIQETKPMPAFKMAFYLPLNAGRPRFKRKNIDYCSQNSILATTIHNTCKIFRPTLDKPFGQMAEFKADNISFTKILSEHYLLLLENNQFSIRLLESGEVLRRIGINTNQTIESLTFDHHSTRLLIFGDNFGQIFFHDLRMRNSLVHKKGCHQAEVKSLKTNGETLLSSHSADRTIKIYDLRNQDLLVNFTREKSKPAHLNWLDQNYISYISKRREREVRFLHVHTGSKWQHQLSGSVIDSTPIASDNGLINITEKDNGFYLEYIQFAPSRILAREFELWINREPRVAFVDERMGMLLVVDASNSVGIYQLDQLFQE